MMKIGQQLYSFAALAKTPEGLRSVLKQVHDIGYRYVQLSGICLCEPALLREMLAEYNLEAVVCHADFAELSEDPEKTIAYYEAVGCPRIGIGGMPKEYRGSPEGVAAFIKKIAPVIDLLDKRGQKLYYHNHAFDFQRLKDGSCNMEHLMEDPRLSFILDTYWIHLAGLNEADYILKSVGHCDIVHFKDLELDGNTPRYAPVGRGNLDWDKIYKACTAAGIRYAFVEQDKTYDGETAARCAAISFQNMKQKGWL